jgi:ATP-dependent RNA helicase DeaD
MQVAEAVHRYGSTAFGTAVVPVYGGQAIQQQLRALRRGVDVIVATPGRALDHIRRRSIDLSDVRFVVLDEADECSTWDSPRPRGDPRRASGRASDGPPLGDDCAACGVDRRRHLNDPVRVKIHREKAAAGEVPRVRQTAYVVSRQHKLAALGRVLDMEDPASAIVFCRHAVKSTNCRIAGGPRYRAAALHGGLTQEQRDRVMRRFRKAPSSC